MLQFSYMVPPPILVSAHQGPSWAWLARGSRNIAAATPVISMSRMVLGDTKASDSNGFLPLFDVSEVAPTVH
jgi:hypothetical protein